MKNFSILRRYDLLFSSPLIYSYKNHTFINYFIKNISNLIKILFLASICIFFISVITNISFFFFLIIFLWSPIFFVYEFLRYKILMDIRNLNFFGLFLIQEFHLILETTQSMEYAVDYFLDSIPDSIKAISFKNIHKQLIKGNYPEEALVILLKEMSLTILVSSLQKIIDDWHYGRLGVNHNENYLQSSLENEIELYNKYFTTWSSLISATITMLPLFSFFLLIVLDFKIWEFFLILIMYMGLLSILFHLLDPFSLNFLKQFGFSNNFNPSSLSAASFTVELANNLQIDPDGTNAIKQTIFKLFSEKKIKLDELVIHSINQIKKINDSNSLNISKFQIKPMLTSLMLDLSSSEEILNNMFPKGLFKSLKHVIEFVRNTSSIDTSTTINHLYLLSSSQARLEQSLQQRFILIKSEYRKTFLLLILQSCALGLLLGLEPFFQTIKNFTRFDNLGTFYSSLAISNENYNIFLTLLFTTLYLTAQIIAFKAVYVTPTLNKLIFYLFIQIICVFFGFSFVMAFLAINS